MTIIMSLVGMAVLILIALLFSSNRRAIRLRTVGGAFAIQACIGAFVLYVPFGQTVLKTISDAVSQVVQYANDGIGFLFGSLADPGSGVGFIFAIKVLPVIIFFSSLIAVLYYLGIMQWVIRILGGALQKLLGTSRTESMSATANIFVGQTEAPLVVRPFIANMTRSELFAVMCGGLASVAGSVLGGYAALGIPMEYLVAASFMAAPGGLLFAKLIMPETEKPNDDTQQVEQIEAEDKPSNVLDAAAGGASSGLLLAANVGAMLLAFIALIALINGMLGGIGGWFGMDSLSLEMILGWLFSPLAFLLGIPWDEAIVAGSFIGQKLVVNEFVAFINLAPYIEGEQMVAATGQAMSEHTQAVLSFALCGFANLSSIAILLGGLGSMAPNRRHEIASFGLKAVLAGTLSNLMSAVIAGLFISLS
ncbi:NupC/NupG family nucleoside CNT transporter [Halomonas sp. HP20-15]|uniref:NupC/NupG family nucleoside CNT transporter n=1 Tax=Halomonas sp. HP20-15 TaxID=3085901 RepID=UPI0029812299|nr:NupC/NupG family nucleoside CNT transporter [Halomonas sp. HP20-15]MDW5378280.1 NupC/NupG family nucleoside CNT transporter [Halomonas sp. HP20-15]